MPIVKFALNFHTPIIIANEDKAIRIAEISDPPKLDLGDKSVYAAARRLFKLNLETSYPTADNPRYYRDRLVREIGQPIRQISYLFDADFVRNFSWELIIIGKEEEINKLLDDLRSLSPTRELTAENVIRFFDFR